MSAFTTPNIYLVPDAEPQAEVAPVVAVIEAAAEPVAAPVKAKAKRKRKKKAAPRAPRTKKADPILLASKQANETPLTDLMSQSVQPLSEEGAAGSTPAAPLHLHRQHIIPATQVSWAYALVGGERATIAAAAASVLAVTTFGAFAAWFWW